MLQGDSSMRADRTVTFRSPSGYEEFVAEFIVPAVTATEYLRLFALGSAWPDGTVWITL